MSDMPTIQAIITANVVEFQRAMGQVREQLTDVGSRMRAAGAQIRASVNAWAKWGAAAATAAVGVAVAITKSTLSSVKELNNLSTAAGLSVEELQRGGYAAASAGIELDKYADILKDVNDKIGDFNQAGSGAMADFFDFIAPKVGVTAEAFRDLNSQDALQLYVSSLEKANLSQAEMTFYMEAIASDSTMLLPLLRDNGKAFNELSQEAKQLGIGLDSIQVKNALAAQAEISKMSQVVKGQITGLVTTVSPLITAFLKEVNKELKAFAGDSETAFNRAMVAVQGFGQTVAFVADMFRGISVFFQGFAVGVEVIAAAVLKLSSSTLNVAAALYDNILTPIKYAGQTFEMFRKLVSAGLFDGLFEQLDLAKANIIDGLVEPLKYFLEIGAKLPDSIGGEMFADALESVKAFELNAQGTIQRISETVREPILAQIGFDAAGVTGELKSIMGNIGGAVVNADFAGVVAGFNQVGALADKTADKINNTTMQMTAGVELDDSGIVGKINGLMNQAGQAVQDHTERLKGTLSGYEMFSDEVVAIALESAGELHDAMLEPMPSERFTTFFNNFIEAAKVARAEMLSIVATEEDGENSGEEQQASLVPEESKLALYQAETIGLLEAAGFRMMSMDELRLQDEELYAEHLQRESDLLREQLARDLEQVNMTEQMKKDLLEKYAEDEARIKQDQLNTQVAIEEMKRQNQVQSLNEGFNALAANSSKVQKLMQGYAIYQAVMDGKAAAVAAWKAGMSTGGPWAPVVAAAYTTASLARTGAMIASIRGGGSSSGSSGGGGVSMPSVPQQTQQSQAPAQSDPSRVFNIEFRGESGTSTQQTRKLLELINEQAGDNVQINLRG